MASQNQQDSLLRIVLVVIVVLVLLPLLIMAFMMPMMGTMGWWDGGGMGMGFSPLWGVGMAILFLVVLLGIVYLLFRALVGGGDQYDDPALEELRMAYARGDLSDEEYQQRRDRLERHRD